MTENDTNPGQQFLPVAVAAERLGVSRLKVREAAARKLIPSMRDNQNKLRLDLSGQLLPDLSKVENGAGASPDMLMDVLFDEIEELHADLANAAAERSALRDLAGRQADALDRVADRVERDAKHKAKLSDLLERALGHLEAGMPPSLERTARAEARRTVVAHSDERLGRVLAAGEKLEKDIAERDRTIERRNATVEQALSLSERAVALAAGAKPPQRKGFWRRLFGL